MPFLNDAGFYSYLRSTEIVYHLGLLGPAEFLLRISFLRSLLDPQRADQMLVWSSREESTEFNDDEGENLTDAPLVDGDLLAKDPDSGSDESRNADPSTLYFLTSLPGVLGEKWRFNQADRDFFPSVPHGHLKPNNRIKLDAYRGYTYDTGRNNKELARESRAFIVSLWNDQKFRVLATNSIEFFVRTHPLFNWYAQRGIQNPFALPRFR